MFKILNWLDQNNINSFYELNVYFNGWFKVNSSVCYVNLSRFLESLFRFVEIRKVSNSAALFGCCWIQTISFSRNYNRRFYVTFGVCGSCCLTGYAVTYLRSNDDFNANVITLCFDLVYQAESKEKGVQFIFFIYEFYSKSTWPLTFIF